MMDRLQELTAEVERLNEESMAAVRGVGIGEKFTYRTTLHDEYSAAVWARTEEAKRVTGVR